MDTLNGQVIMAMSLAAWRDWQHQTEGFGEWTVWLAGLTLLGLVLFLTSEGFKRL